MTVIKPVVHEGLVMIQARGSLLLKDMVGLTDRGSIALGKRADLIRVRRLSASTPVVCQVWRQGVRVC